MRCSRGASAARLQGTTGGTVGPISIHRNKLKNNPNAEFSVSVPYQSVSQAKLKLSVKHRPRCFMAFKVRKKHGRQARCADMSFNVAESQQR